MSKRARFDGDGAVRVTWPPGEVNPEHEEIVAKGHLLSTDAPAAMRDALLKRDNWAEVQDASGSSRKSDDDKDGDS